MRTVAWDTVSQRAQRNCSKEVREEVSTYVILVKRRVHEVKYSFGRNLLLVTGRLLLVTRN